jgi:integration host factor subunit beta
MIKSELVQRVAEKYPHLYNTHIQKMVDAIFDRIELALAQRNRVELRGFGAFSVRVWSARPGRNPGTGAVVSVPETAHPAFRVAKEMRDRLNRGETAGGAVAFADSLAPPQRVRHAK